MATGHKIELGCGLIGIGRTWGVQESPVPMEQEVHAFLDVALEQGIRYFDTAPSYGSSEERFGAWLQSLPDATQANLVVATKFGEHWSESAQEPYADHSYEALVSSLEQSMERLGKIDVLQIHKTTPEVLKSADLKRSLEYAASLGIKRFGASISDVASGEIICDDDRYDVIQLPLNTKNQAFLDIIQRAAQRGKTIVTNRPFNMGELVAKSSGKHRKELERKAFEFIIGQHFTGITLTGTKSAEHLQENIDAFRAAVARTP